VTLLHLKGNERTKDKKAGGLGKMTYRNKDKRPHTSKLKQIVA